MQVAGLRVGVGQHLQQQAGGLVPCRAVVQVDAGQRHVGHAARAAVAHCGDHHILGHTDAAAAAVLQRADGDGIGGAEQAVDAGVALQKLLGLLVAGFHVELGHADPPRLRHQPGVPQCGLKPGPAGLTDGLVQHRRAEKARRTAAFFQHPGCGGPRRAEIIVKDAGIAFVLLAQNDNGDFQTVQHSPVLRRKEGGNEDNAVHRVMAQCVQCLDLALVFVGRVDEQQLIALVIQHAADALDHAGAALAA